MIRPECRHDGCEAPAEQEIGPPGLLSLVWDDDVSQLARALPASGGRVELTEATLNAYQRVVDRILGIWHAGDPLAPFLYRGR